MTRAVDLLRNKFGVSQLYKHDIKQDDEIILTVYWHPLTIAEREAIQKKSNSNDANDFALQMMIEKALDKDGAIDFFKMEIKASLRREVEASILEEIQLAMIEAGADKEVKEAKADLKANKDWKFIYSLAKQLHKTVAELSETLTIEEMIGWAAFEFENEEYEKQKEQAQRSSALKGKRR